MREYNITKKILKLKALILDVDGVLTPGGIWYSDSGDQGKRFEVKDGLGLVALTTIGLKTAIITGKQSQLLEKRACELRISELYQKSPYKIPPFESFIEKYGFTEDEICFVGDDVIDIPVMERCGFSACPGDAVYFVREKADFVACNSGGKGALREICEVIIAARTGHYPADRFLLEFARSLSQRK